MLLTKLLLGVDIFTLEHLVLFVILFFGIISVSILIRFLNIRKYKNEFLLTKTTYFELSNQFYSNDLINLTKFSNLYPNLTNTIKKSNLEEQFASINQKMNSFEMMLNDLENQLQDKYKAKELSSILSYINEELIDEKAKIEIFNKEINDIAMLYNLSFADNNLSSSDATEPTTTTIHKEEEIMDFNKFNEEDENNEFENNLTQTDDNYINEASIFSAGLVIDGNVNVESSLVMKGQINGNLYCKQSTSLEDGAIINGDVHADSLNLASGKIYGDVTITNHMSVYNETYIKGNISADSLEINGDIEGNVHAQSEITFSSNAKVLGDVSAMYITIEKGAKISGAMRIGEAKVEETYESNDYSDTIENM